MDTAEFSSKATHKVKKSEKWNFVHPLIEK